MPIDTTVASYATRQAHVQRFVAMKRFSMTGISFLTPPLFQGDSHEVMHMYLYVCNVELLTDQLTTLLVMLQYSIF